MRPHKECGPDRLSRFDVYQLQTNKQIDSSNLWFKKIPHKNTFIGDEKFILDSVSLKVIKNRKSYLRTKRKCHAKL